MSATRDLTTTPSNRERGASLVEYSLLVAMIALVAIGSVRVLGDGVRLQYQQAQEQLEGGSGVVE